MRKRMTKIFAFCAFSTLALTGGYKVSAATTTVDGVTWNYTLQDGKAADVYAKSGQSRNLVIPDKLNGYAVVSIGGGTESTPVASGINTVQIPESVNRINDYAFSGVSNLESNNLEDVEGGMVIGDKIDYIGTAAFKDCTGIKKIDICNFDGEIGDSAFENCTGITELYVPEVDSLGNYAFKGCMNLENLEVNYSILSNQFQECPSLANIVCDEDVESIGADAFMVSTSGAYKEKKDDKNVETYQQVISAVLCNKKDYQTFLSEDLTRNWFFKNPDTVLSQGSILIQKKDTVGFEGTDNDGVKRRGYYCPITYSCNSIFFPRLEVNAYEIWDGTSYNPTYVQSNFSLYGLACGYGYNMEYYNTPSGYALNKIYVSCTGNPGKDTPEYVQECYRGTIFQTMAAQCVQVYNLQSVDVEIPEYVPVAHKVAISASYNGTVIEGMDLDTAKITVTSHYSDDSTEDAAFSADSMSLSCDKIQVGTNTATLIYDGFSCTFDIEGIEKKLVNVTAELNTSILTEESGYDSDNGTFLEGSTLSNEMFIVTGIYDNGESEEIIDFVLEQDKVIQGENVIEISYKEFTTGVTISGREKQLVSINVALNTSFLTEESGYNSDNETFLEGSTLSNEMFIVTGIYDNGESEEIIDFVLEQDKIVPGENVIEISYKDLTTGVIIDGSEKQPISISAVLNTSNLDSNSGYDNTKGAFLAGSSLANSMFTVTVQYNNGTSEEITDFTLNQNQVAAGDNSIEISYDGVSTKVAVTGYNKETVEPEPDKNNSADNPSASTTPEENTNNNTDNNTNTSTSGGSTSTTDTSNNTESNVDNSNSTQNKNDKEDSATSNKDTNKTNPSKDKKPSKDKTTSTSKNKDKDKNKNKTTTSKKKTTSKTNKKNTSKKKTSNKSNTSSSASKKTSTATTKSSITQNSDVASGSQGSIPVYVDYGNAENPSVKTIDSKDDEVKHLNKKKKNNNKDKDELQEDEKTLNKADDASISSDDSIMYDSIDSNESVEGDTNKKVDVSKKKSGFSPVFIIVLVIIGIAVVGFILNRCNKEEDEEEDDENQQYKEEKLTSDQESEFVEE